MREPMAHPITPTGSNSPKKARARPQPATRLLICQPKPDPMKYSVKPTVHLCVEWLPRCYGMRASDAVEQARLPWNTRPEQVPDGGRPPGGAERMLHAGLTVSTGKLMVPDVLWALRAARGRRCR